MTDNVDEYGYGVCAVCGKYELIKMRSNGKNIGWYCTQRPADFVIEKLELKKK